MTFWVCFVGKEIRVQRVYDLHSAHRLGCKGKIQARSVCPSTVTMVPSQRLLASLSPTLPHDLGQRQYSALGACQPLPVPQPLKMDLGS